MQSAVQKKEPRYYAVGLLFMILASLICMLAIIKTLSIWQYLNDDFYITFAFARNLGQGNGFVYNGGTQVLGTTTPLLAMLLALAYRLLPQIPIPVAAILLGGGAWIMSAWLLYHMLYRAGVNRYVAILTSSAIVLWGGGGWTRFWLGGEQVLFFALLMGVIYCITIQRDLLAGVLIAGLFLTRGEGLLLLPLAIGYIAWSRRRFPYQLLLGFLVPVVLWSLYSYQEFGTPFPATLAAKLAQSSSGFWEPFRARWLESVSSQIGATMSVWPGNSWATSAWLGLVGVWSLRTEKGHRPLILMAVFVVVSLIGYLTLNAAWYPWYTLSLASAVRLFAALGAGWLSVKLWQRVRNLNNVWRWSGRVVCFLLLLMVFVPIASSLFNVFSDASFLRDYRSDPYRELSQWLNENSLPNEAVAYMEIGYLGYFTHLQVVDFGGLVTPEVYPRLGKPDLGHWIIAAKRPEYVVEWSGFDYITGSFADEESFRKHYCIVAQIATPPEMRERLPIFVWQRKDAGLVNGCIEQDSR
jgi:hypothetical protein